MRLHAADIVLPHRPSRDKGVGQALLLFFGNFFGRLDILPAHEAGIENKGL